MTEKYLITQEEILGARDLFKVGANDIAKYIGTTRQTINNYESGRAQLTKPIAICITLYFQMLLEKYGPFDDYYLSQYDKHLIKKFKSFRF